MQNKAETRRHPSLDKAEAVHFENLAKEWWSENGKFRALHAFNPARLKFITAELGGVTGFNGLTVLDIGCGGGILSEPLARLGAAVTGIDPVEASIQAAKAHAAQSGLTITYRAALAEDLAAEGAVFDAVIASEVIEHVIGPQEFLLTCRRILRPGGALIVSTLNRTARSYALAIVAAERVLGLIPRGTHQWNKFIKPEEMRGMLSRAQFRPLKLEGIVFSPLAREWALSKTSTAVNYILSARAI
jgi:2-polyprenyl-6-hydroxyphenyl methylase/3-demethylubiquinone-9 3-methyltransferase